MFTAGALLCAGLGSVHDVRERRIPNRLTGWGTAAGLVSHAVIGGWHGLGEAALAGLIAGTVFLVFCIAGGMGAGDVKLMAAVGCITGLSLLPMVLISVVVAGAAFAIAVSIRHGRMRETLRNVGELLLHHGRNGLRMHPDLNLSNERTLRLPFALPIAAGCLFSLCAVLWKAGL